MPDITYVFELNKIAKERYRHRMGKGIKEAEMTLRNLVKQEIHKHPYTDTMETGYKLTAMHYPETNRLVFRLNTPEEHPLNAGINELSERYDGIRIPDITYIFRPEDFLEKIDVPEGLLKNFSRTEAAGMWFGGMVEREIYRHLPNVDTAFVIGTMDDYTPGAYFSGYYRVVVAHYPRGEKLTVELSGIPEDHPLHISLKELSERYGNLVE